MSYEINVSKDGSHLFATHERSCESRCQLEKVYKTLMVKFPESEGYRLSVRYSPEASFGVEMNEDGTLYKNNYYDSGED